MAKIRRGIIGYIADITYAISKFPVALLRPWTYLGYFFRSANGDLQKKLFTQLRKFGFHRTPWQVVFPGQTAGIVKTIDKKKKEQYHIRFYNDGTVDCELEVDRFGGWHWVGPRDYGPHLLKKLLKNPFFKFSPEEMVVLYTMFGKKPYPFECMRPVNVEGANQNRSSLLPDYSEESE